MPPGCLSSADLSGLFLATVLGGLGGSLALADAASPVKVQSFRQMKLQPPSLAQGYDPSNLLEVSSSPWGPEKPRLTARLIKTGVLAHTKGVFSASHKFKNLLMKGSVDDHFQGTWAVSSPEILPGLNVQLSGQGTSLVGGVEYDLTRERFSGHVSFEGDTIKAGGSVLVRENLLLGFGTTQEVKKEERKQGMAKAKAKRGPTAMLIKWFGDGYWASACMEGAVGTFAVEARATSDLTLAASMDGQGLTTGAVYKSSDSSEIRAKWTKGGIFLAGKYTNIARTILRGTLQLDGATHGISKLGISAVVSV